MQKRNKSYIPTPRPSGFRVGAPRHVEVAHAVADIRTAQSCRHLRNILGGLHDMGIDSVVALEVAAEREGELGSS